MGRLKWEIGREKYLTESQAKQLTNYCKRAAEYDEHRDRRNMVVGWMMVHLGISAGLRVAEITDLRVGDCRVGYSESHLVVRNGKGGRRGEVIIGKALKKHLDRLIKLKKSWGQDISRDANLLLSERNTSFTRSGLQKKFKSVAKRAGLPAYFSVHCLRHTFCCQLLKKTGNLRLVQKQARHSSITTTTIYADICDDEIKSAMDLIG